MQGGELCVYGSAAEPRRGEVHLQGPVLLLNNDLLHQPGPQIDLRGRDLSNTRLLVEPHLQDEHFQPHQQTVPGGQTHQIIPIAQR